MGEWHCGHSEFAGTCAFQVDRRDLILDLDCFPLGTAIFICLLLRTNHK